jgi:uncharacterized membrane protein YciS (DUF1049 family)
MKKTNRQLILGSLQPLLFCIGMYFVVLIFSVFICTSLYRVMKTKKTSISMDQKSNDVNTNTTTAMLTVFK